MVDRTVTVRLRLDSTQWAAGQSNAVAANNRLAASAQSAAAGAERAADRTAAAVSGTFGRMAAQGTASLGALDAAATRSSAALANNVTAMTRQTATAATAASRATTQASSTATAATNQAAASATAASRTTVQANSAAAAATRQVATAAGEIPAAFRSASASAAGSLSTLDAAAAAARAQTASAAVAARQGITGSAAAVNAASAGIRSVTASGIAGANRLSMAARLTLAQAAAATQTTTTAAVASAARASTAAHLTAAGATNAAAGAAAATARADANARALSGTFASATARARTMGTAIVTAAGGGEKALKGARLGSLALIAVFGAAVYANSKFETSMSGVKAATQGTAAELAQLRQAAIQAGGSTQFSATQAADAETELAKAGVSTADILGGALRGTLNLAAAGQMDVADSAVVAAKAMNSFGLTGTDMAHIADVIAAAAGKSATDVHGMSLAFAQAALLAHQTGLTLEQTAGALALFAQNGLVGSDAGTSLKTMLMRLTPQSQQARDMMDKLGFSAYDSSGKFIGWSKTAQGLHDALAPLTPQARNTALAVIFGSDAIRAATIVSQAGAKGVDQWTKAANDQGYAARYAATQTDNLSGDLRRLKSALETALIQSGSAANGVLRDMAKQLTDVVRWYSSLPPTAQKSATVLAGVAGMVGLVATSLLLMLPRIAATGTALKALGVTAAGTKTALTGLGRMTLVVGVLTAMTMAADKLTAAIRGPGPDVAVLTDQLTDLATSGSKTASSVKQLDDFGDAVARIAHPSTLNRLDDVASSVGHLGLSGSKVGSYTDAKNKINALDESLAQMVQSGSADLAAKSFTKMATEANKSGTSTDKLRGMLPKYKDALATADAQQKSTTGSSKAMGDQAETTADEVQDTRTEVEKLTDALDALNGNNIDVAQSSISFQQSLADLKATVKDSGHSLDDTTSKGRKVKGAFLDAADAAMKHAEAVTQSTNSQAAGNKVLAQDVTALKSQMIALGFSKTAVDKLLASYAQVPSSVVTTVVAQTDPAAANLDAIRKKLASIPAGKSITVRAPSAAAIADLKAVGYKVTTLPNHQIKISVPTSNPTASLRALQARIDAMRDHTVVVTIQQRVKSGAISSQAGKNQIETRADGGIVGHAANGLFVPGYQPRVDSVHAILSKGEGVLVPEAVRKLGILTGLGSAGVIKQMNAWGRYGATMRFSGGGTVGGAQHFASGGFTYSPSDPTVTLGADAGMDRYDSAVAKVNAAGKTLAAALADAAKKATAVRDAEKNLSKVRGEHHTASQLAAAEEKLTKARQAGSAAAKKVTADRKALNSADSALGVKAGTKSVSGFNLGAYEKQLAAANKANAAWEANLAKIGAKAGGDVEDTLRGMGSDGTALVAALAKASGKTFTQIVNQLKALAPTAQATLKDYTAQLAGANKASTTFQANLLKLAGMGDTALASQLAAQGDDAAAAIAAAAVKSPSAASTANKGAAANAALLTTDDLAAAVTLLGVLKAHPGAGIADVIAAGLDWSTVRALAPKIASQIKAVSGSSVFVGQMRGQGVAMARGGILTRPTAVVAAEAGKTESWIPWDGSARSSALLSATAAAMGYQLVPAGRYAGTGGGGGPSTTTTTTNHEWHLHGAHQSLAEQKADLVRQMSFVG
jgi:TP901 family phage tail tape measure protein